jgi:hypothetical protein
LRDPFRIRENFWRWWAVTPTWLVTLASAVALLVLGLTGWRAGIAAYDWYRKAVIERNGRQAVEAAAAGDWDRAGTLALAVVVTGDQRIEVLRVLVDSMRRADDRRLVEAADALMSHPECNSTDRLTVFQWSASSEPLGRVWMRWQRLSAENRAAVPFKLALVDRFIQDGDFALALEFLKDYKTPETPPEVAARVIRALIVKGTPPSLELAQTGLADQVTRHPDGPVEWLDLLESLPVESLDGFILEPLRPWLRAGRQGQPGRGELMEARIRLRTAPEADRGKVVAEAVAKWRSEAPHVLCRFLAAVDRSEILVETFTDEVVAGDAELVKARLGALIRLGRTKDLETSLALHEQTLPPTELFAYQAVAADRAGNDTERNRCWDRVLAEGRTSPRAGELLRMNAFAEQYGLVAEAQRTLLEALKEGWGALPSFAALTGVLKSLGDKGQEHEIMAILATYLGFEPGNSQLICRHAYLAALLGLETPAVGIARLSKLKEPDQSEPHLIAVLAALHLLAGDIGEAGNIWDKLPVPPEDLAPGFRTAWLSTQVVAGKLAPEAPAVADIPWKTLLPCERTTFEGILRDYRNAHP